MDDPTDRTDEEPESPDEETQPQSTKIRVAKIGAIAVLGAALIGIIPSILEFYRNREAAKAQEKSESQAAEEREKILRNQADIQRNQADIQKQLDDLRSQMPGAASDEALNKRFGDAWALAYIAPDGSAIALPDDSSAVRVDKFAARIRVGGGRTILDIGIFAAQFGGSKVFVYKNTMVLRGEAKPGDRIPFPFAPGLSLVYLGEDDYGGLLTAFVPEQRPTG